MKAFLSAVVVAVVVAIGAAVVLDRVQEPSTVAFTTSGARL